MTGLVSPRVATLCAIVGVGMLGVEALRRNMLPKFLTNLAPVLPWIFFVLLSYAVLPLIPYAGSRAWNNLTGMLFAVSVFSVVRIYGRMKFMEPLFMGYVFIVLFFFVLFPSVLGVSAGQSRLRLDAAALGKEGGGLNPNDVARLMGVSGLIILGSLKAFSLRLITDVRGLTRAINVAKVIGVAGAIFVIIFYSGSRSALAWVAAMIGFVFAAWFNRNIFLAVFFCVAGSLSLITITYFIFPDLEIFARVAVLFDEVAMRGEGEKSFYTRMTMIKEALAMWQASPIWGNGNEAYRVNGSYGTYSHTNYTELLANYGALGFIFFYLPFGIGALHSWKMRFSPNEDVRRQALWLFICCAIPFVISFVNVIYYTKYMLLFFAVIIGRVYYLKDNYQRLSKSSARGHHPHAGNRRRFR